MWLPEKHGLFGRLPDWFGSRLNAAASLFQTRKSKLPVKAGQHASGKEYYRAADHARTNGWELSLNGRINERWLLNASYTRAKTKDSDGKQLAVYYPSIWSNSSPATTSTIA